MALERMLTHFKKSRERFLDRHCHGWQLDFFSAATLVENRLLRTFTQAHARGRVLDAGCGRGTWKPLLEGWGCQYVGLDMQARGHFVPDHLGDVTQMPQDWSESFDTIICHQVLEHVPRPWEAAREFHRVLVRQGRAVVSVPHLSRYHEMPHDYFRYTAQGLRSLMESSGFQTVEILAYGGLGCFLHHQWSTICPGLIAGIPVLGTVALAINALPSALIAMWENRGSGLMPLGICGVFEKSGE